jgi:adenine deaminase
VLASQASSHGRGTDDFDILKAIDEIRVIPELRLTDLRLVDVNEFKLIK